MLKFFKQLPIYVFAGLLLTGCFNDNREPQPQFLMSLVTIQNPNAKSQFFLLRDDNKLLWFAEGFKESFKPEDGERYLIYYNIIADKSETGLYDYDVRITDAQKILTKGIFEISPETQDSIGNDWIAINQMWIVRNYLNIDFSYYGYSSNTQHYINLVADSSKTYTDDKIHLEFRHNANKDEQLYKYNGLASFDISSLEAADADSVKIVVHIDIPDEMESKAYNITYKYKESNTSAEDAPKPTIRKSLENFIRVDELK